MPLINEVKKFEILTNIKENQSIYASRTIKQIQDWICKNFDTQVSSRQIRAWAKLYGFSFKAEKRSRHLTQAEEIKRTNQRIRLLSIAIRNLCKELEIKHPSMLDKLITGITEQYGTPKCFENNPKELENKIYDLI